jgi:membrane fusion protein, multidrug efflux system
MTGKTRLTALLFAGVAVIAGLNQYGIAVPGLEWVRVDTALVKLGLKDASTPTSTAADAPAGASGKRAGGGGGGRRGGQDGPVPVVVAPATVADVPVYLRGVGSARAPQTVTVRPQVDGKLIKVSFREGQDVKKGDLLAQIDPVTYQAAVDQAIAKRNTTQSQLTNAQLDLDRYSRTGPGVTALKTIDTQKAQVVQLQAQLKSDTAAIENAQAVLGYTTLLSPIDGRTGQRLVDEGNLVRAGDAGIVTIAQLKPIAVQFTLPQQQLVQVNTAMQNGAVLVEAMDNDDKGVLDSGALTFIDNQIDPTTGTVKMKADLPNDKLQLWPGQFANVRVRIDVLKQAVTAPTAAIQRGSQGTFVYVVANGDKPKAALRLVTVAQQDDRVAVVTKGIGLGELVVTSGFARLKDQAAVDVTRTEGQSPAAGEPKPTRATRTPAETSSVPDGVAPTQKLRQAEGDTPPNERRGKRRSESSVQ